MSRAYRERVQVADADIQKWAGQHVMVEEPVRSFRFHGHYTDKKHNNGLKIVRPGFRVYSPSESAKFTYTSTYAFTLTWTPGHMTLVGDLGEMNLVHYYAMPTFEEALDWVHRADHDYLLGKAGVGRVFDRDQTIDDIWQRMTEYANDHMKEMAKEIEAYEKDPPKWRKRDGMTKADFERDKQIYAEDHPRIAYGFREVKEKPLYVNRNLWRLHERIGWHVPDGFELMATVWKFFQEDYSPYTSEDPNTLLTEEGRNDLKAAIDSYCRERSDDEISCWVYRDLDMDDYSGIYEYPERAFTQISAIKHGVKMILDGCFQQKKATEAA